MQNKIIYSFILVSLISCSNFKPFVFTEALIVPESTTTVDYEDLNFQYALFNQYASALSYSIRIDYSNYILGNVNNSVKYFDNGTIYIFNDWDIVTATYAEAVLNQTWRNRINTAFFNRSFNQTTKVPTTTEIFYLEKQIGDTVNLTFTINSSINYNVNVGSVYLSFANFLRTNVNNLNVYLSFYNSNNQLLQQVLLDTEVTSGAQRSKLYNLSTVITNVKKFEIAIQFVDIPPYVTAGSSFFDFYEFNLFTQAQEITIPDDVSGDRFGFEFVAVEWWNFLGHLQNFAWWIVNKSPVAPVFEFIDEYIVTWISGLINFITGVFNI